MDRIYTWHSTDCKLCIQHTDIHTQRYKYIHTLKDIHTYSLYIHKYIYTQIHTYIRIYRAWVRHSSDCGISLHISRTRSDKLASMRESKARNCRQIVPALFRFRASTWRVPEQLYDGSRAEGCQKSNQQVYERAGRQSENRLNLNDEVI